MKTINNESDSKTMKYLIFDWATNIQIAETDVETKRPILANDKLTHNGETFLVVDVCVNSGQNCVWISKQMQ